MLENQYLIVHADDRTTTYYCYEEGKLRKFTGASIKTVKQQLPQNQEEQTSKKKPAKYSKGKSLSITARNNEQACAIDLLKDDRKTIKTILGV